MIREAIRRRASFNVIHLATMFKADVFIRRGDAWSHQELSRARCEEFDTPNGRVTLSLRQRRGYSAAEAPLVQARQ